MDIGHTDVVREIGEAHMNESDPKFNEEVFEFINSAWREHDGESSRIATRFRAM